MSETKVGGHTPVLCEYEQVYPRRAKVYRVECPCGFLSGGEGQYSREKTARWLTLHVELATAHEAAIARATEG